MRLKLSFFFLVFFASVISVHSQDWIRMMQDPAANFYTTKQAFLNWKDSMIQKENQHDIFRIFRKEKYKELTELREEADEHFHHWEILHSNTIDANGNPLSADEIWMRYKNQRIQNNVNLFSQGQGNWFSRGPDAIDTAYGSVLGIGRTINMVINPNDSNVIYVSSGYGLFKSVDHGTHWTSLLDSIAGLYVYTLAIDPLDGNKIFAIIGWKLYKSTDGGGSWTQITTLAISNTFVNIRIDASDTSIVYLSTSYYGFFKSTDGGNTFSQVNPIEFYDIEIKPGNANTIYGLYSGYLMRSIDGGLNFDTASTIPAPSGHEIAVTPADSQYVYACSSGGTSVSTDGGDTFTLLPQSSNLNSFNDLDHLAVSPIDKNLLLHGGVTPSVSTDGGQTWNFVGKYFYNTTDTTPYVHPDDRGVLIHGNSLWLCTDGGVVKSVDRGHSWINLSNGLSNTQFTDFDCSESDTSVFIGGAIDNSIFLHTDSGWVNTFGGDGYNVAINPTNKLNMYAKNQYGYYRSTDGGLTNTTGWPFQNATESYYGYNAQFPVRFNYQNTHSLFLSINHIWKSTNDGDSAYITPLIGSQRFFVSQSDSNIIFSYNMRSLDNGNSISMMPYYVLAGDQDEPGKVWGVDNYFGPLYDHHFNVYFSIDTGNTWNIIPSPELPVFPVYNSSIFMCAANNIYNGIFLAVNSTVYYIDDRLSNWQPFVRGLPLVPISQMRILPSVNTIRVSTLGRGIWESSTLFDTTQALVVDFLVEKDTVCPNNPIQFYDNSLNNGPGFNPVYHWYFPGGTPSYSTAASPIVYYSNDGTYNVSLSITNINGTDSIFKTNFINVNTPIVNSLPLLEGFEGQWGLPPGWNQNYYRENNMWSGYSKGAYNSSARSICYLTYYNIDTLSDSFITPLYDFTQAIPMLKYDYVYVNDSNYLDTLKIFYTTDCGLTKTYVSIKSGWNLMTDTFSVNGIQIDSADWRPDSVSLDSVFGKVAQIGFEVKSKTSCAFLIDNINIYGQIPTGIAANEMHGEVNLYPNPATNEAVIYFNELLKNVRVSIYSTVGTKVFDSNYSEVQKINLSLKGISEGVYMVVVEGGNLRWVGRVVVVR